ncbi:MAG: hypothetical protein H0V68_03395 [Actinobacteria bacterium]|nr:hypothetical protein [Actinomycetota bacterium]
MRSAAALALAGCSIAAGCGGSSSAGREEPVAGSLEALWRAPGEDVAIVAGSEDFAPGPIRLTFLIVDGQGRLVTRPTARVWLSRALKVRPYARTTARSERIGVDEVEPGEAEAIFVTHFSVEEAGTYWVLAEPVGGRKIQAVGTVVVRQRTRAPDVGDHVPESKTPTLETATLAELTTAKKPDPVLYRRSIAEDLRDGRPFVVVFATPEYCTSRTCGPVVEVVSAVRRRHASSGLDFVHVEIYEENDPAKGENRWVREWKLPSEPWVFLVGADGRVRERFEGTVSVPELDAAVRRLLRR